MKKSIIIAMALGIGCMTSAQNEPFRNTQLSAEERAADLLQRLTLDEKMSLMMYVSPQIERVDMPAYNWWNEALHGVGRNGLATVFPQCIGMAATFDDDAVLATFTAVSDEARAKYNYARSQGNHGQYAGLSFWTPNINIFRDPRWGRGQETYGEDPYLTSRMGVAVVDGLQGPKDTKYIKTLACAKHYAVHSGPEWNRHSYDAHDIDPRDLYETYLPAFKALVDDNVWQVMCAYNRFEGEPCCSNSILISKILRDDWGYKNIVVTDCGAIFDFFNKGCHETNKSGVDASAASVLSGTDLECGSAFSNLPKAYAEGLISEEAINEAVRRLLVARFLLGEYDDDHASPWAKLGMDVVDSPAHRQLALDMARKSMTLLKNDGATLPLAKGAKVVVMGPNANDSTMQWGNYNGDPSHTVTILDGIRQIAGADVPYTRGCDLVINNNFVSDFNLITHDGGKPGLQATYWNTNNYSGDVAATDVLTTPLNFSTQGATVFAPGVNLNQFSGKYRGTFTPIEDATYVINLKGDDKGIQRIRLNGELVAQGVGEGFEHDVTYTFDAQKGQPIDIELEYEHHNGAAKLTFDIGRRCDYDYDLGDADIVVFVGGISPRIEGEEMPVKLPGFRGGDRESIELPAVQRNLMRKLKEQGKKVIFVCCSGSAIALADEDATCDAILQAWYPGQAGGQAVAEVLYGLYNPAGRLPVTFYRDDSQLPDFEDYSMDGRTYRYMTEAPLYPFGHGLSYTTFAYPSVKLGKTTLEKGKDLPLQVSVANTGSMDGDEVVQVYIESVDKGLMPKALREFKRQHIKAGDTATLDFTIPYSAFETYDYGKKALTVVPGKYRILYGPSSAELQAIEVSVK